MTTVAGVSREIGRLDLGHNIDRPAGVVELLVGRNMTGGELAPDVRRNGLTNRRRLAQLLWPEYLAAVASAILFRTPGLRTAGSQ